MSDSKRISAADLTEYTVSVLRALGAPEDRSRLTAGVLVGADLRGISSHGVAGGTGIRELVNRIQAGAIHIEAVPDVQTREGWAAAAMDAKGGLGHAAAMEAARLAGDLAEKHGVGKVHIRNGNHFGAACIYAEDIIARGLAGRVTCNASAWMPLYGGNRSRLGTNPIAWGFPCGEETVIVDMATTQRAISPALRAARAGAPIPPEYFLDEDGQPLNGIVPLETLMKGSVLPLGGSQFGYKGSALSMMVDLDGVVGGGPTERIRSQREFPESRVAQTFEAWRLDLLFPEEEARKRLAATVADYRKFGGPEMLLPGEREARKMDDAERNGIPYEPGQWDTLREIAGQVGVPAPG